MLSEPTIEMAASTVCGTCNRRVLRALAPLHKESAHNTSAGLRLPTYHERSERRLTTQRTLKRLHTRAARAVASPRAQRLRPRPLALQLVSESVGAFFEVHTKCASLVHYVSAQSLRVCL